MKRFMLAITLVAGLSGCAMKGRSIPGAPIPFAKADYTVLGATNAEECGTYVIGIDWAAAFKSEGAMITPGTFTLDGAAGTVTAGASFAAMGPEGSRALYYALEKMPDATHLLAPTVHTETTGLILSPPGSSAAIPIFGKRCTTVEARGVKIGDKPTANQ